MRTYSMEEVNDIGRKAAAVFSTLVTAAATLVVGVILIKIFWAWTIPDLFPSAVELGLIADDLTWLAAVKAVTLAALVASTGSLVARRWIR